MLRLRTLYSRAALTLALALPLPWLAAVGGMPSAEPMPSALAAPAAIPQQEPVAANAMPAAVADGRATTRQAELIEALREHVLAGRVAVLDASMRQPLARLDAFLSLRESGLGALPRVRSQASRLRSMN